MRSNTVDHNLSKMQQDMYSRLNKFSQKHNILGRASAIPVAAADVTLETLKTPLKAIECVAMAAMNLFGSMIGSYGGTAKLAMFYAQSTLGNIACIPIAAVMVPFKLLYQMFAIARDPKNALSINFFPSSSLNEKYGLKIAYN